MKRTYPKHIASIIDEAISRAGLTEGLNDRRAAAVWIDVVGPGINRYTTRRYVDRGVMHVYLSSAPLKSELSLHRQELVRAINKALGEEVVRELFIH
ncbi:MAG: DUF721 domain-containing protein [Duncaniella sp.]|nr:DUF721 domain-containing protein [Duncaniella sp.]MDE5734869.1 DUF721 domain-containing protein [Duncaniella sp.]MDE6177825.1 DUF721 domain-containing protein [Duncaniella sp.]MDE6391426.1 DUF721 domain-containing protein [Duncaniella sp.]